MKTICQGNRLTFLLTKIAGIPILKRNRTLDRG